MPDDFERRTGVEERVRVLERMMFGYLDETTNVLIPGVMQKLTDLATRWGAFESMRPTEPGVSLFFLRAAVMTAAARTSAWRRAPIASRLPSRNKLSTRITIAPT